MMLRTFLKKTRAGSDQIATFKVAGLNRHIVIRPLHANDFSTWKVIRSASRDFLQPWEPSWAVDELTLQGFRRRLQHNRIELKNGTGSSFVICDELEIMGGISISNIRRGAANSCTLGYWMGEAFAGLGIMKKAVHFLCQHIFEELRLERIEASCLPDNQRSIRLLEGLGFVNEGLGRKYLQINGVRRDHLLFGLLSSDLKPIADQ